jgi:uncharacterized protein YdaU (DUF1376 family)
MVATCGMQGGKEKVMADIFWFRHDTDASSDIRMQRLSRKYGMEGVGIYWTVVEALYREGGVISLDKIPDLAYSMHAEEKTVDEIIKSSGLFQFDKSNFWSKRALNELSAKQEISEKARQSAKARWTATQSNSTTDEMRTHSDGNATALDSQFDGNANTIQNNTEQYITKEEENTCPELAEKTANIETAASPSPVFIELPAIGSPKKPEKVHKVTEEDIAIYQQTYPAVDVKQELRQMSLWLTANPSRKKSNTKAFIVNWLKKSQDRSSAGNQNRYQDNKPRIADSAFHPSASRGPLPTDGKPIVTDFTL